MKIFQKREPWYGPDSPKESRLYQVVLGIGVAFISAFAFVCLVEMNKEWARRIRGG